MRRASIRYVYELVLFLELGVVVSVSCHHASVPSIGGVREYDGVLLRYEAVVDNEWKSVGVSKSSA